MLIQFTVGNFYSIKDPATINLSAISPIKEYKESNVFHNDRYQLLKSAVIYGANASGKSKFLKGIDFMKWFVINSSKSTQKDEKINIECFRLDNESCDKPSLFELSFLIDKVKYRYGFKLTSQRVVEEWLFNSKKVKEYPLFIRDQDGVEVTEYFPEGNGLEERTRDNALFLSVNAQFNGAISGEIIKWFSSLNVISGLEDRRYQDYTSNLLRDPEGKLKMIKFLKAADNSIKDIELKDIEMSEDLVPKHLPIEIRSLILKSNKAYSLVTYHEAFDKDGKFVNLAAFDFEEAESEGTKKFFRLAGPILDSLKNGKILVIDELDARLHPLMTKSLVDIFNSVESNPKNAQLIFATHDTNLLSVCNMRRDQIWFAEKTKTNSTDLYSLAEYKMKAGKVRNDASFERNYLKGRYGAIPFIGDINSFIHNLWQE